MTAGREAAIREEHRRWIDAAGDPPPLFEAYVSGDDVEWLLAELAAAREACEYAAEQARRAYEREEKLREALRGLDGVFGWLEENYPKALREMPTDLFRSIRKAGAALSEGEGYSCVCGSPPERHVYSPTTCDHTDRALSEGEGR